MGKRKGKKVSLSYCTLNLDIWLQSLVNYFFICIFLIILVNLDASSLFCEVFWVLSVVIGLMSCWSSYCWLLMLDPSQIRIETQWFVKYMPFNLLRVPLHQCLFGQKAPSISCRCDRAGDAVILSQKKITWDRSIWICIRATRGKPWWTSGIHPWTDALPHQTNDSQTDGCCSHPVCWWHDISVEWSRALSSVRCEGATLWFMKNKLILHEGTTQKPFCPLNHS